MNRLEYGEELWLVSQKVQQYAEDEAREEARGFDFYPVALPNAKELNPNPVRLRECVAREPEAYEALARVRRFSALLIAA